MIRSVKIGEQFPDLLHHSPLLPVGSTVGSGQYPVRVQAPGLLMENSGRPLDGYYLNSPQRLLSLPEGDSITIPKETSTQFKWRLRDAALAAAERAGVRIDPVREMLADIGAASPVFTIGGIVSNQVDLRQLPTGTIVYNGHPSKPAYCTVWRVTADRSLDRLMGSSDRFNGMPVIIRSAPELPPVEEEDPAEESALARIALHAWRIGKSYKRRQSWCTTFENTLEALGINDKSINEGTGESMRGPGDTVSRDAAAMLPEGSLLWWQWHNDSTRWALYRRVNTARNTARTIRVTGHNDDMANSHKEMIVVSTPQEEMVWNVHGSVLRNMPDGVIFSISGGSGVQVTKDPGTTVEYWRYYRIHSFPAVV